MCSRTKFAEALAAERYAGSEVSSKRCAESLSMTVNEMVAELTDVGEKREAHAMNVLRESLSAAASTQLKPEQYWETHPIVAPSTSAY